MPKGFILVNRIHWSICRCLESYWLAALPAPSRRNTKSFSAPYKMQRLFWLLDNIRRRRKTKRKEQLRNQASSFVKQEEILNFEVFKYSDLILVSVNVLFYIYFEKRLESHKKKKKKPPQKEMLTSSQNNVLLKLEIERRLIRRTFFIFQF